MWYDGTDMARLIWMGYGWCMAMATRFGLFMTKKRSVCFWPTDDGSSAQATGGRFDGFDGCDGFGWYMWWWAGAADEIRSLYPLQLAAFCLSGGGTEMVAGVQVLLL